LIILVFLEAVVDRIPQWTSLIVLIDLWLESQVLFLLLVLLLASGLVSSVTIGLLVILKLMLSLRRVGSIQLWPERLLLPIPHLLFIVDLPQLVFVLIVFLSVVMLSLREIGFHWTCTRSCSTAIVDLLHPKHLLVPLLHRHQRWLVCVLLVFLSLEPIHGFTLLFLVDLLFSLQIQIFKFVVN
jgi:hypothetical protein